MKSLPLFSTVLLLLFPTGPLRAVDLALIQVEGQVLVKRSEWPKAFAVRRGTVLMDTDLLESQPGARVMVLCPDLKTFWRLPEGKRRGAAVGCPAAVRQMLTRQGQKVLQPRGGRDGEQILLPRRAIHTTSLLLQWGRIGNATQYEVQISREGEPDRPVWGPVLVEGLELKYPSGKGISTLIPAVPYQVQVRPSGTKSFIISDVPFSILEPAERRRIENDLEQFRKDIGQDPVSLGIARAVKLAAEGVYGEALSSIASIQGRADSAAVDLLAARYTEELGLFQEASRRYRQAFDHAEREETWLVQAEAREGMARTEPEKSLRKAGYEEALQLWLRVGDKSGVARLRQALTKLQ